MAYPEKYLNELFSDDIISQHSETQSEVSSNHSDWSDLQLLANQLGIPNASDLYVERFKIDRQQLSSMLQGNLKTNEFTSINPNNGLFFCRK